MVDRKQKQETKEKKSLATMPLRPEKRGDPTSVRMTPTIKKYVLRNEGKTFSDKFHNMVLFCMQREEVLHDIETEYIQKLALLDKQIKEKEYILEMLNSLEKFLTEIIIPNSGNKRK